MLIAGYSLPIELAVSLTDDCESSISNASMKGAWALMYKQVCKDLGGEAYFDQFITLNDANISNGEMSFGGDLAEYGFTAHTGVIECFFRVKELQDHVCSVHDRLNLNETEEGQDDE